MTNKFSISLIELLYGNFQHRNIATCLWCRDGFGATEMLEEQRKLHLISVLLWQNSRFGLSTSESGFLKSFDVGRDDKNVTLFRSDT